MTIHDETDRQARNRIARECAELRSQNDDMRARLELADPLVDAALIFDDCDQANDDPNERDTHTAADLLVAAAAFREACEQYRAAQSSILSDQI